MNPQEPSGPPQHQFQEPQLPPGVTPHAPEVHNWVQPPTSLPPSGATPSPEKHYGQPGPHAAVQPYDFILNPEKPRKKPLLASGGNSLLSRLAIIFGGVVVFVILAIIVMSLLGGKSPNLVAMTTVAQDQTELVRVAHLADTKATAQGVANVSTNAGLSLASAQQQLLDYLAKNGLKLDKKQLSLKLDKRTDTQLQTAAAASNFDSTFVSVLETQLTTYQRDLKTAYSNTTGPKGRALLSSQYTGAGLLLKQLK